MTLQPTIRISVALCLVVATWTTGACVRRTITITTEPPGALVFLNDQEVGRSEVSTDFLWYGDYGVTVRKKGYATLKTNWKIDPPWYQRMPIDFVAEVLWPGHIHDTHSRHFVLEEQVIPSTDELAARALSTRALAVDRKR